MAEYEAKLIATEEKHGAQLAAAFAKYKEKCKAIIKLEAELEVNNKDARNVGDDDISDPSVPRDGGEECEGVDGRAYSKKCKEVERLKEQISVAHQAFGDMVPTATQTRSWTAKSRRRSPRP